MLPFMRRLGFGLAVAFGALLLTSLGCGEGGRRGPKRASSAAAGQPAATPERDAWWATQTLRASGKERVLAPRELRRLLAQGRTYGFDRDAAWWKEKSRWAYARVLELDETDVEANAGVGRRTLQSIEGFAATWEAMQNTRVDHPEITAMFEQYGGWVEAGDPIFLTDDEYSIATARLTAARQHIARLAEDPEYEAVQIGVQRARAMFQTDFPFVHKKFGPFLVFYSASDLERIEGEESASETARIEARREAYRREMETWRGVYEGLLADLQKLYPEISKARPIGSRTLFVQWVFADAETYLDFANARGARESQSPYRRGYFDKRSGWTFSSAQSLGESINADGGGAANDDPADPADPADTPSVADRAKADLAQFLESQAYLAAAQILRSWAHDPKNPLDNRLDYSRAYWLKEGWPSFMAARQVKSSQLGKRAIEHRPTVQNIVERRSRVQSVRQLADAQGERVGLDEAGFSELAYTLVQFLHTKERAPQFRKYLRGLVDGKQRGITWFETVFEVKDAAAWMRLDGAVYATR